MLQELCPEHSPAPNAQESHAPSGHHSLVQMVNSHQLVASAQDSMIVCDNFSPRLDAKVRTAAGIRAPCPVELQLDGTLVTLP